MAWTLCDRDAAAPRHRQNLTCVFVDNGLLRLNEAKQVMDMFGDHFGLNIVHVEGEQRFWTR